MGGSSARASRCMNERKNYGLLHNLLLLENSFAFRISIKEDKQVNSPDKGKRV